MYIKSLALDKQMNYAYLFHYLLDITIYSFINVLQFVLIRVLVTRYHKWHNFYSYRDKQTGDRLDSKWPPLALVTSAGLVSKSSQRTFESRQLKYTQWCHQLPPRVQSVAHVYDSRRTQFDYRPGAGECMFRVWLYCASPTGEIIGGSYSHLFATVRPQSSF